MFPLASTPDSAFFLAKRSELSSHRWPPRVIDHILANPNPLFRGIFIRFQRCGAASNVLCLPLLLRPSWILPVLLFFTAEGARGCAGQSLGVKWRLRKAEHKRTRPPSSWLGPFLVNRTRVNDTGGGGGVGIKAKRIVKRIEKALARTNLRIATLFFFHFSIHYASSTALLFIGRQHSAISWNTFWFPEPLDLQNSKTLVIEGSSKIFFLRFYWRKNCLFCCFRRFFLRSKFDTKEFPWSEFFLPFYLKRRDFLYKNKTMHLALHLLSWAIEGSNEGTWRRLRAFRNRLCRLVARSRRIQGAVRM